jgi:hypothetical protein
VSFDQVGSRVRATPDSREKVGAGDHLPAGFGQAGEQRIFASCKLERAALDVGHVLVEVDDDRSAPYSGAGDPPQHRAQMANERPRLKRASHEVVGALVERSYVMVGAVAVTKYDDRPSVACLPKPGTRIDRLVDVPSTRNNDRVERSREVWPRNARLPADTRVEPCPLKEGRNERGLRAFEVEQQDRHAGCAIQIANQSPGVVRRARSSFCIWDCMPLPMDGIAARRQCAASVDTSFTHNITTS